MFSYNLPYIRNISRNLCENKIILQSVYIVLLTSWLNCDIILISATLLCISVASISRYSSFIITFFSQNKLNEYDNNSYFKTKRILWCEISFLYYLYYFIYIIFSIMSFFHYLLSSKMCYLCFFFYMYHAYYMILTLKLHLFKYDNYLYIR